MKVFQKGRYIDEILNRIPAKIIILKRTIDAFLYNVKIKGRHNNYGIIAFVS